MRSTGRMGLPRYLQTLNSGILGVSGLKFLSPRIYRVGFRAVSCAIAASKASQGSVEVSVYGSGCRVLVQDLESRVQDLGC